MHDQHADHAELPIEIGVGPLADGLGDLLHARRAFRGAADLSDEHQGIGQAGQRDDNIQTERDFLVRGVLVATQRREELEVRRHSRLFHARADHPFARRLT